MKINEQEIRKLIRESVRTVLEERKKGLLLEMPLHRNVYKERVDSILPQVLTNWCLVRYCTLSETERYKKHWKDKLRGHLYTVSRLGIKGNDSIESREKVFEEILDDNDYDIPHILNMTVCNKFIKEKINIESEEYETALMDCITNLNSLFKLILNRNIQEINSYVDKI